MRVEQSEMRRRWAALERAMEENGYDVMLIYGKGIITQYGYLTYFGNYYPVLRPGYIVFAKGQKPVAYYSTQADCFLARQTGSIEDVRFVGIGDVIQTDEAILGQIVGQIHSYRPGKVGIVGMNAFMTYDQCVFLTTRIEAEVDDATGLVAAMKAIKSEEEREGVRGAFALAERSFAAFRDAIKPGRTPAEIAGEIERIARGGGAIDTLVFIEEGPYFLRKPTLQPLGASGLITAYVELIDSNGYWVEKAGLFTLGKPSQEALDIGEACVSAMNEVRRTIRPGKKAGEIAEAIRRHTDHLNVRMGIWHGHGVGIDHDLPIIADRGEQELKEGMVVSVHPNFADSSERCGASIADVFILGKDKAESLSKLPYDMVQL